MAKLAIEGGKLVIIGGKLGFDGGCCCPDGGDCETCCGCFTVSVSIGTETGSVEVNGVPDSNNCICTFPEFSIPMFDGGRSSTITVLFLQITATKAVIRLNYNDIDCCAGANDEDSWYVEDAVVNTNCYGSISFSVVFPTVGTATVTLAACTPCAGNDPKIIATVTGSGTGTAGFAGHTWNLPEDSGQPKPVCPDTYLKGYTFHPSILSFYSNYMHVWRRTGTTNFLRITRFAGVPNTFSPTPLYFQRVDGRVTPYPTTAFTNIFISSGYSGGGFTSFVNTPPDVINEPKPTAGAYTITDAFFGSATTNTAIGQITYKWEKGPGW